MECICKKIFFFKKEKGLCVLNQTIFLKQKKNLEILKKVYITFFKLVYIYINNFWERAEGFLCLNHFILKKKFKCTLKFEKLNNLNFFF